MSVSVASHYAFDGLPFAVVAIIQEEVRVTLSLCWYRLDITDVCGDVTRPAVTCAPLSCIDLSEL